MKWIYFVFPESWNAGLIGEPFNTKLRLACPEPQQKVSVDLYKVFTSIIHIRQGKGRE